MSKKLTFTEISKLLEEYAGNEVALHILDNEGNHPSCLSATFKCLSRRQDEVYRAILTACGLEIEETNV